MKKYEVDPTATKDGKLMENDIVLFRYADALLMKSEAKVRNGANGDEELNEVRSRVNASPRTATLENILAERQLELAWEGWRRQDLVRFGKFTRAYSSRPQLPDEASGYTTVFPIPEKIRVMNERLKYAAVKIISRPYSVAFSLPELPFFASLLGIPSLP